MDDRDIYESIMNERLEAEVSRLVSDVFSQHTLGQIEASQSFESFSLGICLGILAYLVSPEKTAALIELMREDAIKTGYLPPDDEQE